MPRRVKDFIDISEYTSLDDLIRYLETIRDNLPAEHEAELKIRGDEVFGRRLTITYFRELTPRRSSSRPNMPPAKKTGEYRGAAGAGSTKSLTGWARRKAGSPQAAGRIKVRSASSDLADAALDPVGIAREHLVDRPDDDARHLIAVQPGDARDQRVGRWRPWS